MFVNPIGAEITVIRIKACLIRNSPPRNSPLWTLCLWIADQELMITHFNIATRHGSARPYRHL
jgi:hypothetical protein